MSKLISQYLCQQCGYISIKWLGKCPDCNQWNTFVEEVVETGTKKKTESIHVNRLSNKGKAVSLKDVASGEYVRLKTKFMEFNRVMGGGITAGSLSLIGGDPGIGKSTLMMQVAGNLNNFNQPILYVSGEESLHQIRDRAERLNLDAAHILLLSETDLNEILGQVRSIKPGFLIIDSIQTVYLPDISSAPGSVSQVRESASAIMHLAKSENITTFITGHVTKEGSLAGPRVLEHLVDTVLQFEGDRNHQFRILRALKNRFGSTNEIGVFDMKSSGLTEISNPSEVFLSGDNHQIPGSVIVVTMEGTRPIVVELQALVSTCNFGFPQRNTNGYDQRRMTMLIAVLEKRLGISLGTQDIFLNVVSGLKLEDPGVDLGVCAAMISSFREWPVSKDVAFIGEVGLGGEIRVISSIEQRLMECAKLGFKKLVVPAGSMKEISVPKSVKVYPIDSLQKLMDIFDDLLADLL